MNVGIIPARLASTRFPGKPLEDILGIPMVIHCYFRARLAKLVDRVFIATCDSEIRSVAEKFGALVVMTSREHLNAIDRSAEAYEKICSRLDLEVQTVVVVQGDEPLLDPTDLDLIINFMGEKKHVDIANLMVPFSSLQDFHDPNNPKVVVDFEGRALYMSRSPIPADWRGWDSSESFMQTGLFGFRPEALAWFSRTTETPLETIEAIDMLRFLQSRRSVYMVKGARSTVGVDTPDDIQRVRAQMAGDPLFRIYAREIAEGRYVGHG